jgi:hypothetical protein
MIGSAGGERLEEIVEAANRVAAKIREEAEAQARRYVEDARRRAEALTDERVRFISEASDSLLEQGRMMKAQTEQLVEALRDAAARIATATSEVEPPGEPPPPPARRERTEPVPPNPSPPAEVNATPPRGHAAPVTGAAETVPPAPLIARPASKESRLLATRMAVAGSNPRQVEARLREVGVEDPVGLVDAVFSDI